MGAFFGSRQLGPLNTGKPSYLCSCVRGGIRSLLLGCLPHTHSFGDKADVPSFWCHGFAFSLALFSSPHLANDFNSFLHLLWFSLNLRNMHLEEELAFLSPFRFWQAFKHALMKFFKSSLPILALGPGELRSKYGANLLERWLWRGRQKTHTFWVWAGCLATSVAQFFHISKRSTPCFHLFWKVWFCKWH